MHLLIGVKTLSSYSGLLEYNTLATRIVLLSSHVGNSIDRSVPYKISIIRCRTRCPHVLYIYTQCSSTPLESFNSPMIQVCSRRCRSLMNRSPSFPSLTPSLYNADQLLRNPLSKLSFATSTGMLLVRGIKNPLNGLPPPLFDTKRDGNLECGPTTSCSFQSLDAD